MPVERATLDDGAGLSRIRARSWMAHVLSLTANVYTDPKLLDVVGAVASLPDLPLGAVGVPVVAVAVT